MVTSESEPFFFLLLHLTRVTVMPPVTDLGIKPKTPKDDSKNACKAEH